MPPTPDPSEIGPLVGPGIAALIGIALFVIGFFGVRAGRKPVKPLKQKELRKEEKDLDDQAAARREETRKVFEAASARHTRVESLPTDERNDANAAALKAFERGE